MKSLITSSAINLTIPARRSNSNSSTSSRSRPLSCSQFIAEGLISQTSAAVQSDWQPSGATGRLKDLLNSYIAVLLLEQEKGQIVGDHETALTPTGLPLCPPGSVGLSSVYR